MPDTASIVAADQAHCWHPFTPMGEWCSPEHEPLVLVEGEGATLLDSGGRQYIDGNSSIWTNLHGHRQPRIDAAIRAQLALVAHTSFLGFTNPPAAQLARELAALWPERTLQRVFFSDDGSTAIECAIKMAAQYWQLSGETKRRHFVAFAQGYHGDTMGASSLGGIPQFHERFTTWQFPAIHVRSLEELDTLAAGEIAAVVIEPLIQGAAGMRLWPRGMLRDLRAWCDARGPLLIADEVMTGFGRTGTMFACEQEHVAPDLVALAKGLTGGYLPLGATLVTERLFQAFLGSPDRAFYYGHSYTGNQLACAAALASLAVFREERVLDKLAKRIRLLSELLRPFDTLPHVYEVRQCGFIAGIELRRNPLMPFRFEDRIGARVCVAARRHGLLTRPIGDVIVLMPPYCISEPQLRQAADALAGAIDDVCGHLDQG